MNAATKRAIAFVSTADRSGTGFLVGNRLLATARHVVSTLDAGAAVEVCFTEPPPARGAVARLLRVHPTADLALLELDEDAPATPLRVVDGPRGPNWETWGFPGAATGDALVFAGTVVDADASRVGRPALQLSSVAVGAGNATPVHGLSGAPVLVDGAVVGVLERIVSDPDDRTRPAFGFLWASPGAALLALLAGEQTSRVPTTHDTHGGGVAPPTTELAYHALIVAPPEDRAYARALQRELRELGARVASVAELRRAEEGPAEALRRCLAMTWGVVWLGGGLDAPLAGHQRVVVQRSEQPFPGPLAGAPVVDERDRSEPAPEAAVRILVALQGGPGQVSTVLDAVEEAARRIRSAATVEAAIELWTAAVQAGLPRTLLAEVTTEDLANRGAFAAAAMVAETEESDRLVLLRALIGSRSGDFALTIQELGKLAAAGQGDAETAGILAGALKRRWRAQGRKATVDLAAAYGLYRGAWDRNPDNTWVAVNTAATALWQGRAAEARGVALRVLDLLARKQALDAWELATRAEARLLLGDLAGAADGYREAIVANLTATAAHQVMAEQARESLSRLGFAADSLDGVFPLG